MKRVVLALCASVLLGLSIGATGCDDSYNPGAESGGAKGPEILRAPSEEFPASGTASSNSPGTPNPPDTVFPTVPCGEGRSCAGTDGCVSMCDSAAALFTSCTSCLNGAYTTCTTHACTPNMAP